MPKTVQMPDGSTINFPDDMDDNAIHTEGLKYMQSKGDQAKPAGVSMMGPSNQGRVPDSVIDFLRPLVSGAAATGAVALSGPGAPVAGAAAYTGIDALLQHLKTKQDRGIVASTTGMEEGGLPATLTNTAEQYGLGKLGEKIIGAGGRAIKAIRNVDQPEIMKLTPTTSQALESSGYSKLASVTKAAEDLAVSNKNRALDRTAGKGFSEALAVAKRNGMQLLDENTALANVQREMPFGEGSLSKITIKPGEKYQPQRPGKPFQPVTQAETIPGQTQVYTGAESTAALDKVIADPQKLQATLSRASELGTGDNLRTSLRDYQFSQIFNKAVTSDLKGSIRIDPKTIGNEWLDPNKQESFAKLFSNKQKGDIDQFFKNLSIVQDKVGSGSYRKLWLMEGGVGLATGLLTGSPIHGAGGIAGVYLGGQALSRLLTNPKTARIAVALAGGEPLGVSEQFAGKIITRALQGTTVALINEKGEKVPGTFRDGQFVPLQ